MTSFGSTSLLEKFPLPHQRSLRLQHLPLAPSDPHPDTGELLQTITTGTPSVPSRGRESYVKLNDLFDVPVGLLVHVHAGTARLTKEAMTVVTRKILDSREIETNLTKMWRKSQGRVGDLKDVYDLKGGNFGSHGNVPYDTYRENPWVQTYESSTNVRSKVGGEYMHERNHGFGGNYDRGLDDVDWNGLVPIIPVLSILFATIIYQFSGVIITGILLLWVFGGFN